MASFTEQQKIILFWEILDLKESLQTKWAAIDNFDGDERDTTIRLVDFVLSHFRPESQPSPFIVLALLDQIDGKVPGYALKNEVNNIKDLILTYQRHANRQNGSGDNEVKP